MLAGFRNKLAASAGYAMQVYDRGMLNSRASVQLSVCTEYLVPSNCKAYSLLFTGDQPQLQDCCLLLGTSLGYMQLHAEDGQLLHRQRIHTSQAQNIQARTSGMGETTSNACCPCPRHHMQILASQSHA